MSIVVKNNIHWVGQRDWEVRDFHGTEYKTLRGSSYNSYLIREEKNVLIDTVDHKFSREFVQNLRNEIDLADISVEREACPMHLAPTSSTVNTLMMGDALAMAVMQARGFNEEDFARSHPAGALGARLLNKVHHLMRRDDAIPQVALTASVMDAMLELSRTGLGLVAVCDAQQQVQGVFTDGDLRRWLVGGGALTTPVNEAMTVGGTTLQSQSRAIDAKEILMKRKITAAPVVDENGKLTGAINLQDFYQAGII